MLGPLRALLSRLKQESCNKIKTLEVTSWEALMGGSLSLSCLRQEQEKDLAHHPLGLLHYLRACPLTPEPEVISPLPSSHGQSPPFPQALPLTPG